MKLSMGQRKAVTKKLATTYKRGSRPEKSRILDELTELTGWHRDDTQAAIRSAGTLKMAQPPVVRTSTRAYVKARTMEGKTPPEIKPSFKQLTLCFSYSVSWRIRHARDGS